MELAIQQRNQARRIPALAAHLLDFRIELIDQRREPPENLGRGVSLKVKSL